jgi:hypothetical protein
MKRLFERACFDGLIKRRLFPRRVLVVHDGEGGPALPGTVWRTAMIFYLFGPSISIRLGYLRRRNAPSSISDETLRLRSPSYLDDPRHNILFCMPMHSGYLYYIVLCYDHL